MQDVSAEVGGDAQDDSGGAQDVRGGLKKVGNMSVAQKMEGCMSVRKQKLLLIIQNGFQIPQRFCAPTFH